MLHKGARVSGGTFPAELQAEINKLLDEFLEMVISEVDQRQLRQAVVRSILSCNIAIVLDSNNLWILAERARGLPSTRWMDERPKVFDIQQTQEGAVWDLGFDDPFFVCFPAEIIEQLADIRKNTIQAIAKSHVEAEYQRVQIKLNVIQINPIFGPASYVVDPRLAFVLMPFTDELTKIYNAVIKPCVENSDLGLVCKRADEIRSAKTIMQDIWKSICEARIIIADLTGLNPNVMYEVGIAHTLGKETVLVYQTGAEIKIPFDLTHIRRIEYTNDAIGGKKLETELRDTLRAILNPQTLST